MIFLSQFDLVLSFASYAMVHLNRKYPTGMFPTCGKNEKFSFKGPTAKVREVAKQHPISERVVRHMTQFSSWTTSKGKESCVNS